MFAKSLHSFLLFSDIFLFYASHFGYGLLFNFILVFTKSYRRFPCKISYTLSSIQHHLWTVFLWLLTLSILPGLYIKLSIYGIILAGIAIGKPICQTNMNSTRARMNSYITIILECLCMICFDKIWHFTTLSTAIFLGSCAAAILYIPGRIFQHNT